MPSEVVAITDKGVGIVGMYFVSLVVALGLLRWRFRDLGIVAMEPFDWGPFCDYHQSICDDKE